jgi:5-oxopent-3-ene-1,2,5-tricarboxylate decarboxylase/2-hydroxyhepta-2,4-diene-1,7-dioate isomerase
MAEIPHSVIGVALNFRETLNRLAPSFTAAPYQTPPIAPVLYLKTPNTWIKPGDPIPCPAGITHLRMAGTLGIVIARTASRVKPENASHHIAAFTVVNDVSIPHPSFYRPALRERCSDSFCAIAPPSPLPPSQTEFEIDVLVNNVLRSSVHTSSLVRPIPQLIADISEFLTLHPGDILLIGEPDTSPLCAPDDNVRIEIPGVGSLENKVVRLSLPFVLSVFVCVHLWPFILAAVAA